MSLEGDTTGFSEHGHRVVLSSIHSFYFYKYLLNQGRNCCKAFGFGKDQDGGVEQVAFKKSRVFLDLSAFLLGCLN